tara:strand:+ start:86 stop:337 length:252 start_codon:yes stop_codon:yes gene_type:complete
MEYLAEKHISMLQHTIKSMSEEDKRLLLARSGTAEVWHKKSYHCLVCMEVYLEHTREQLKIYPKECSKEMAEAFHEHLKQHQD